MARTATTLREKAVRELPGPFRGLDPLIGLAAGPLALVESAVESHVAEALPSTATGAWLTLIGNGQGLPRVSGESDASLRDRIRTSEQLVTVAAIRAAVDDVSGLAAASDTCFVVEDWKARVYCKDQATEYITDAFCDEETILPGRNAFSVILPTGLDDEVLDAVCALLRRARAAGVTARLIVHDDGPDFIHDYPWEEA